MTDSIQDMTVEAAHLAKTRALTLFETRADLYYRRTGYLAPGKDCRMHNSGSEANHQQFAHWYASGLMQIDALLEVARLRESLEAMEARAEDADAELMRCRATIAEQEKDMQELGGLWESRDCAKWMAKVQAAINDKGITVVLDNDDNEPVVVNARAEKSEAIVAAAIALRRAHRAWWAAPSFYTRAASEGAQLILDAAILAGEPTEGVPL